MKVHWNTGNPETCAYRSTKIDKMPKTVHMKISHKSYRRLWNTCLPMEKLQEEILDTARNQPIGF